MQYLFKGDIYCLVLVEITGNIQKEKVDTTGIKFSENIRLADPNDDKPDKTDILIGVGLLFYNLLSIRQIRLNVSGYYYNLSVNNDIQHLLTKFSEIEEISSGPRGLSQEEITCEKKI